MAVTEIPPFHTDKPSEDQLAAWEAQVYDKGYVIIPDALPQATVAHFRERIAAMDDHPEYSTHTVARLFETGLDFVHLLENEPVVSLAERLFGERMHIIALQGHRMRSGNEITGFHSDELYLERPAEVSDEVEYPPIINVINCHYYLVDVPIEMGPTEVVPGSHQACRQPRPEDGDPPRWRAQGPVAMTVRSGDCVIYNNQAWHRGAPNTTDETRLSVVPSYARRFVAQRFWPFLNYQLDSAILETCTPRQRELLGEHPRGAYG
jgi:hypothetical protein